MSETIMTIKEIKKEKGVLHCCGYDCDGNLQIIKALRRQKGSKNKVKEIQAQ